jgi:hypothetical protein
MKPLVPFGLSEGGAACTPVPPGFKAKMNAHSMCA